MRWYCFFFFFKKKKCHDHSWLHDLWLMEKNFTTLHANNMAPHGTHNWMEKIFKKPITNRKLKRGTPLNISTYPNFFLCYPSISAFAFQFLQIPILNFEMFRTSIPPLKQTRAAKKGLNWSTDHIIVKL